MKHAFKKKYLLIFIRLNVVAFYLNSLAFYLNAGDLPLYLYALIFQDEEIKSFMSVYYVVFSVSWQD